MHRKKRVNTVSPFPTTNNSNLFQFPSPLCGFDCSQKTPFRCPRFTCLILSPQRSVIIAPNVIFDNEVNDLLFSLSATLWLITSLAKVMLPSAPVHNLKGTCHEEKLHSLNWIPDAEINFTCVYSICVLKKAFGFRLTKIPIVQTWNFAIRNSYGSLRAQFHRICSPSIAF